MIENLPERILLEIIENRINSRPNRVEVKKMNQKSPKNDEKCIKITKIGKTIENWVKNSRKCKTCRKWIKNHEKLMKNDLNHKKNR